jgi:tellurite resistance protein TerC
MVARAPPIRAERGRRPFALISFAAGESCLPPSIGSPLIITLFLVGIGALLALDLGVINRKAHQVRFREALGWSAFCVGLSLSFNIWMYFRFGGQPALEFLTGYLIEYALSVDNIFVFIVIFNYFAVPAAFQHRVLFWGILGAIGLRAAFILIGAALLQTFHWVIFVFGAFLVYTGFKILAQKGPQVHPERNPVVKFFRRLLPLTQSYHGQRFLVRLDGRRYATPLLLVLVMVEATDVVFAVDSIPAIFAVTRDPFIVFTSNIFAILGLRALYFLLASILDRFHYLSVGIGLVLVFVGAKMLVSDFYHVPIGLSLGVVVSLLAGSVIASLLFPRRAAPELAAPGAEEPGADEPEDERRMTKP